MSSVLLFSHINEVLVCFHDFIVGNILRGLVVLCRVSASLQALPSYSQNTAASQNYQSNTRPAVVLLLWVLT